MEKYVAQVLFLVGLAVWLGWVIVRRYLSVNLDKNKTESGPVPTDEQVRRHLKNMREDLSLLTVTNFAILLVLVYSLVLRL